LLSTLQQYREFHVPKPVCATVLSGYGEVMLEPIGQSSFPTPEAESGTVTVEPQPSVRAARINGVPPVFDRVASYAWRLVAIAAASAIVAWALGRIIVVVGATFLALIIARGLQPVAKLMRRAKLGPGLAAAVALLLFITVSVAVVVVVAATVVGQMDSLSQSLDEGARDVEEWVTSLSVVDVDSADLQRFREQAGDSVIRLGQGENSSLVAGATTVGELLIGLVLALIVAFFFLKDGTELRIKATALLPVRHRAVARDAAFRAWGALGSYLHGSALLGIIESVIFGGTLFATGASLTGPVMILTFIAAFVPIVGAIAAGIVAVLVALATSGVTAALVMAGVALVVQQFDNDLLAPVLYGRALRLHPLVVLLGVASGGAAFGLAGSVAAVPVLAVLSGIRSAFRTQAAALRPPAATS
jgi:putative heme transporter